MANRYAVYYTPEPDTALWKLACNWLGRDPITNTPLPHPAVKGLSESEIADITARPRCYGFHATLKAPFTLREGTTKADLRDAVAAFARRRRSFRVALGVGRVNGFLALVPRERCPDLNELAAACVEAFEPSRAPLGEDEIGRRMKNGLTPREQALLKRWGYPYVMDRFRFHMTLTRTLPETELDRLRPLLEDLLDPVLREPVAVDTVALFVQPDRDSVFTLTERFPFRNVTRAHGAPYDC